MKIRTGFVSNSSSSSFLLVGITFNKEDETDYTINDWARDNGLSVLQGEEDGVEGYVLGTMVAEEDDMPAIKISLNDFGNTKEKIREAYEKGLIDINDFNLYVFSGTRMY